MKSRAFKVKLKLLEAWNHSPVTPNFFWSVLCFVNELGEIIEKVLLYFPLRQVTIRLYLFWVGEEGAHIYYIVL